MKCPEPVFKPKLSIAPGCVKDYRSALRPSSVKAKGGRPSLAVSPLQQNGIHRFKWLESRRRARSRVKTRPDAPREGSGTGDGSVGWGAQRPSRPESGDRNNFKSNPLTGPWELYIFSLEFREVSPEKQRPTPYAFSPAALFERGGSSASWIGTSSQGVER